MALLHDFGVGRQDLIPQNMDSKQGASTRLGTLKT
jgi:hypothetical protein